MRRITIDKLLYDAYVNILKEELVPAMGCTEPIALAYAAALARKGMAQADREIIDIMLVDPA